jgi:hypothetical protein
MIVSRERNGLKAEVVAGTWAVDNAEEWSLHCIETRLCPIDHTIVQLTRKKAPSHQLYK